MDRSRFRQHDAACRRLWGTIENKNLVWQLLSPCGIFSVRPKRRGKTFRRLSFCWRCEVTKRKRRARFVKRGQVFCVTPCREDPPIVCPVDHPRWTGCIVASGRYLPDFPSFLAERRVKIFFRRDSFADIYSRLTLMLVRKNSTREILGSSF